MKILILISIIFFLIILGCNRNIKPINNKVITKTTSDFNNNNSICKELKAIRNYSNSNLFLDTMNNNFFIRDSLFTSGFHSKDIFNKSMAYIHSQYIDELLKFQQMINIDGTSYLRFEDSSKRIVISIDSIGFVDYMEILDYTNCIKKVLRYDYFGESGRGKSVSVFYCDYTKKNHCYEKTLYILVDQDIEETQYTPISQTGYDSIDLKTDLRTFSYVSRLQALPYKHIRYANNDTLDQFLYPIDWFYKQK